MLRGVKPSNSFPFIRRKKPALQPSTSPLLIGVEVVVEKRKEDLATPPSKRAPLSTSARDPSPLSKSEARDPGTISHNTGLTPPRPLVGCPSSPSPRRRRLLQALESSSSAALPRQPVTPKKQIMSYSDSRARKAGRLGLLAEIGNEICSDHDPFSDSLPNSSGPIRELGPPSLVQSTPPRQLFAQPLFQLSVASLSRIPACSSLVQPISSRSLLHADAITSTDPMAEFGLNSSDSDWRLALVERSTRKESRLKVPLVSRLKRTALARLQL